MQPNGQQPAAQVIIVMDQHGVPNATYTGPMSEIVLRGLCDAGKEILLAKLKEMQSKPALVEPPPGLNVPRF